MKYRRDIDGLRALAILPVLLFHYKLSGFRGGFLGVDIFFVISGFLITKIVNDEISAGHFSIGRFYERRVRRIFPALFAMMATVFLIAFFLFLPIEFANLGKSIVATTLFVSNFYFAHCDSYFGPASEHEPLLHTWSLAVEEQFYIVLPVALLLLRRNGRRTALVTMAFAAVASFCVNVWLLRAHPTAAFYLPIPRAWELLSGSLLALGVVPSIANRSVREALAALGLALVAASVVFYKPGGHSMLPFAIFPCVGAALLIVTGGTPGSAAGRLLSTPVFVYIGTISYSLYLWHWPLLIMYQLAVKADLGNRDKVLPIALSIAVAAFSARFIERPFRKRAAEGAKRPAPIFRIAAGTMVATVSIGLLLVTTHGLQERFPEPVRRVASYLRYTAPASFRSGTCFLEPTEMGDFGHLATGKCLALARGRRNYLLAGDSHAAHLWIGLTQVNPQINFLQATAAGCKPLLVVSEFNGSRTCPDMMKLVLHDYVPAHKLDGVILSARWDESDIPKIVATTAYIRRYQPNVYVVGRIVEYVEPLPRVLALSELHHDPNLIRAKRVRPSLALESELRRALRGTGVTYISLYETFCNATNCQTVTDTGAPMQFDYGHLTDDGSRQVAREWKRAGTFPEDAPALNAAR